MRRRQLIPILGTAAAWPLAARAQQPVKRIAHLVHTAGRDHIADVFEEALRQHGWVPGRNITVEYRFTGGRQDAVAPIVAEMAALKMDAIVAWSVDLALAAKRAMKVPLVFLIPFDPVETGLVSNLAAPEGNVTGITLLASLEIIAKRLQLLKEAVPSARSVAVLLSTEQNRSRGSRDALDAAARALNLRLHDVEVVTAADLVSAIGKAKEQGADALYVWTGGFAYAFAKQIADLAIAHRLPSVHGTRAGALSGGLLAYIADIMEAARLGAEYVAKILNGARPGSLPVQQLSKYELLINLKTSKALDLDIPPSLIARADEVIE